MSYLDAVEQTSASLRSTVSSPAHIALGIELARLAWQHLARDDDPTWDLVGLELLALTDPTHRPELTTTVDGPERDCPALRDALIDLFELLAQWHDDASKRGWDLSDQLQHSAAAAGLRRAAELLR